jgi:hypothetical protein
LWEMWLLPNTKSCQIRCTMLGGPSACPLPEHHPSPPTDSSCAVFPQQGKHLGSELGSKVQVSEMSAPQLSRPCDLVATTGRRISDSQVSWDACFLFPRKPCFFICANSCFMTVCNPLLSTSVHIPAFRFPWECRNTGVELSTDPGSCLNRVRLSSPSFLYGALFWLPMRCISLVQRSSNTTAAYHSSDGDAWQQT